MIFSQVGVAYYKNETFKARFPFAKTNELLKIFSAVWVGLLCCLTERCSRESVDLSKFDQHQWWKNVPSFSYRIDRHLWWKLPEISLSPFKGTQLGHRITGRLEREKGTLSSILIGPSSKLLLSKASFRLYSKVNKDSEVNGGVFLCMKAGYYEFSAGIGSSEYVETWIMVNSRGQAYARYLMWFHLWKIVRPVVY